MVQHFEQSERGNNGRKMLDMKNGSCEVREMERQRNGVGEEIID